MRELTSRNIAHFGQLFVFTATSPVEATPQRFYFGKVPMENVASGLSLTSRYRPEWDPRHRA